MCLAPRRMYSYTRLKLFPIDKNPTARWSFHLKLLTFLLFVTVIGVFLKSGNIEWLWFQDQSQPDGQHDGQHYFQHDGQDDHADKSQRDLDYSEDTAWCRHPQKGSVTPFLSAKTKLSEDAFKWWKHVQKEQGNLSYFEETVNKLFEIFPPIPDLGKPKFNLCSTCAVVGNSLNLKGSNYGPLIDSKDIIMRMNFAPTKGYEEDVGTKTTHHVMYPESAVDLDNSTHLVLLPFKILDLEWLIRAFTTGFHGRSYAPIKSRIQANKNLVIVISPAFMKDVHQILLKEKGSYPSTGFLTVVLALHICDEISVFGYGADRNGQWSHYFETLKDKSFKTGKHPGQQEYKILQKLNFEELVKLYPGA
ncbi:CMP-N-acetylneuraminate-beta-galactosamide-alpha-2,3-sialyltransferase 1-like [Xiphophorus couchianus]|uniref:CMP-N-acetylneuraminate-beta-galactosamide- alpha-2,3-sialyltransferase 1-like n=1 Tax=Xiphophorus couchianus TaxID=32473 RepID=UPI001016D2D5|nr:CMP-N-acetylneuraminate-beta-galactosamide-alpha-2,3-sialyltransferase 1-like [Xiphophorus couchianus]XP_027892578.1 CMP-N-acetylneuraminate-beta-galactosamide-alpha-2,3-sialyltransferase 1-like [Xiphophorus couchianus]